MASTHHNTRDLLGKAAVVQLEPSLAAGKSFVLIVFVAAVILRDCGCALGAGTGEMGWLFPCEKLGYGSSQHQMAAHTYNAVDY